MQFRKFANDKNYLGSLYFTWDDIVDFANNLYKDPKNDYDLAMNSLVYISKIGRGDWKVSKNGAREYRLVSMEGIPYWADAVGQIPYALYAYNNFLMQCNLPIKDVEDSVIYWGNIFASGGKFEAIKNLLLSIVTNIDDNTYDNVMIKRGIKFAHKKYKRIKQVNHKVEWFDSDIAYQCKWEITDTNVNPNLLSLDLIGNKILK